MISALRRALVIGCALGGLACTRPAPYDWITPGQLAAARIEAKALGMADAETADRAEVMRVVCAAVEQKVTRSRAVEAPHKQGQPMPRAEYDKFVDTLAQGMRVGKGCERPSPPPRAR